MSNVTKSAEGWVRFNDRTATGRPVRRLHPDYEPQSKSAALAASGSRHPSVRPKLRAMRRVVVDSERA